MAKHFHLLRVNNIRIETDSCVSVSFEIPPELKDVFRFIQGQNITIRATIAGEDLRRSYSICSSPPEQELRIAVKKVEKGKFSAWINNDIKSGDLLEVLPPTGKFYTTLDPANHKHYIAFAAGSGITPLLSIIKTTLAAEPNSRFTLFYGNQTRGSIIFREELEAIKNMYMHRFGLHHILSRETMEQPIYQGRITEDKCAQIFTHIADLNSCDEFFLCGPEAMIISIKTYLENAGIESDRIHFELFSTPGQSGGVIEKSASPTTGTDAQKTSLVTIQSDGLLFTITLPYEGASILDAALASGVDLPFACKGGVCATCRAKLLEGEVYMDNNYALEKEEIENRYILTCQSHPRSARIRVDFDYK